MAYLGYLIKVGDYKIPHSYIGAESYSAVKNTQDIDSYRDANGELHRDALEHTPYKVEFETRNMLTNTEFSTLMRNIKSNFINTLEKKANVTLYLPEEDDYVTQDIYMPDIQVPMYFADDKIVKYKPIRLAFIGY